MTALEEIKKAEHERIWLEPAGAPDRCWCQDNQWGEEGVEYVLASTIESLQRENGELRNGMKTTAKRLRDANAAFERERKLHLENQDLNRKLIARAEAAEAKVKRLKAERLYIIGFNDGWEAAENEHPAPAVAVNAFHRQADNMAFIINHVGLPDHWREKFMRELDEDRSSLSSQVQDVAGWQDIGTLEPKDGIIVMGWGEYRERDGFSPAFMRWYDSVGGWSVSAMPFYPTHWMPLPAAPAKQEGGHD